MLEQEIRPLAPGLKPHQVAVIARQITKKHEAWMRQLEGSSDPLTISSKKLARPLLVDREGTVGILLGAPLGPGSTRGGAKTVTRAVAVVWDAPGHPHALPAVETKEVIKASEADRAPRYEGAALLALKDARHVVHAFSACEERIEGGAVRIRTLQEHCQDGDLISLLERYYRKGPLPEGLKLKLMHDVLSGLVEIHASGRVHRDIKPDNIFLSKQGDEVCAKIGDFGFTRPIGAEIAPESFQGTLGYFSPESVRSFLDRRKTRASPEDDVFALGVVMHALEHSDFPFFATPEACEEEQHLQMIAGLNETIMEDHGLGKASGSDGLRGLIRAMLSLDPEDRPTARDALTRFEAIQRELQSSAPAQKLTG